MERHYSSDFLYFLQLGLYFRQQFMGFWGHYSYSIRVELDVKIQLDRYVVSGTLPLKSTQMGQVLKSQVLKKIELTRACPKKLFPCQDIGTR